jgi:hypothetical protein
MQSALKTEACRYKKKVWLAGKSAAVIACMGDRHILKAGTLVSVKLQAVNNLHVTNRVTSILINAYLDQSQYGRITTYQHQFPSLKPKRKMQQVPPNICSICHSDMVTKP